METTNRTGGTMITFGIITNGKEVSRVNRVIDSILPQFRSASDEIIVCCDKNHTYLPAKNISAFRFNKDAWITRKKNLIAQEAKNNIIVLLHDYIELLPGWRSNFDMYGYDWDVCMHQILNLDDTRYRDWCAWDDPNIGSPWTCLDVWCPEGKVFNGRPHLVPYSYNKTQYMYISGAYFVCKKKVLLDCPLDENLVWGQGEDVKWSIEIRNKYKYVMNEMCKVKLLKQKDVILPCYM